MEALTTSVVWILFVSSRLCDAIIWPSVMMAAAKPPLRVRTDGTFKVLQLADLHYGEDAWSDWGPQQDFKSSEVVAHLLEWEQPDLAVYSGDQITANNLGSNAKDYWERAVAPCVQANVPWLAVLGNHDDMPLDGSSAEHIPPLNHSHPTRRQLLQADMAHALSYTQMQHGEGSTYRVDVEGVGGTAEIRLWVLDSGGGTRPERVPQEDVDWLVETARVHGRPPAVSLAFVHIPLPQYRNLDPSRASCVGTKEDGIDTTDTDTRVFEALFGAGVGVVAVGHDHGNDFCCPEKGMWLCFGRHTGYGGYGSWARGGRVYHLHVHNRSVHTYVRMENGSIAHAMWLPLSAPLTVPAPGPLLDWLGLALAMLLLVTVSALFAHRWLRGQGQGYRRI